MIRVDDKGTIAKARKRLEAVGKKRLEAWVRYAMGEQTDEFVAFIKANYLSGQRMSVVTGETREHVGGWLQRKLRGKRGVLTYLIRPGVGISGLQNYLERYVGTRHEFMGPAWQAFGQEARFARAVDNNLMVQVEKYDEENA